MAINMRLPCGRIVILVLSVWICSVGELRHEEKNAPVMSTVYFVYRA
jgi:hypothetical protein